MAAPPRAVAGAMAADARQPPKPDKLELIRNEVRAARDLETEIQDLEERAKEKKKLLVEIRHKKLPELFMENRITGIDLVAEGNYPAYDATLSPYYHANIASDWESEKKAAGFAWLEKRKHGDVIKNVVTVELSRGKGAQKMFSAVTKALKKLRVPFQVERAVPWNSLTALVRELTERGEPLGDEDRETIGATVGVVVKLKPKKQEK